MAQLGVVKLAAVQLAVVQLGLGLDQLALKAEMVVRVAGPRCYCQQAMADQRQTALAIQAMAVV